jgi:hypothetical protein
MSIVQRVAQIFGVVFILVALLGFLTPGGTSMEADVHEAPHLLGLFPVNLLPNLVHLAFGVWGLLASRTFSGAKTYAQVGGVAYLALAVLGLITPDTFGLIPIGGHDVWLHAVLGIALAYFGFTARETQAAAPRPM